MGVNAEAWVRNTFDLERLEALPAILNEACPGREMWFWDEDPDSRKNETWKWDGGPTEEALTNGDCGIYAAGMLVHIYKDVMIVHSLARWRGFIAYPGLRGRVRAATSKVVRALGATDVIWLPDWFLNGFPPDGEVVTMDGVRRHLLAEWGPPQPSLDAIDEAVMLLTEHSSPRVWFQETIE